MARYYLSAVLLALVLAGVSASSVVGEDAKPQRLSISKTRDSLHKHLKAVHNLIADDWHDGWLGQAQRLARFPRYIGAVISGVIQSIEGVGKFKRDAETSPSPAVYERAGKVCWCILDAINELVNERVEGHRVH